MGLTKSVAKNLARVNGLVIGIVFGLAVYTHLSESLTVAEMVLAAGEVGTFAGAAAGSGVVLSEVNVYPTSPVLAGALSGLVGGGVAYYLPTVVSVSVTVPVQAIGGFIASFTLLLLMRLTPGL